MTWTTAGFAALVNANNTGTLPVECKYIALGTGTTAASAADTALESEIKRIQTISGTVVDNNVIHVVLRDETSDTYQATEVGLIAADGTLLARYAQANPLIVKAAGAVALLAIDASFTDVDATQISFGDIQFINPPWGEDTQGVVKKATLAQAKAGEDNNVGMTPRRTLDLVKATFGTLLNGIAPVGAAFWWNGQRSAIPDLLLPADGQELPHEEYQALLSVLNEGQFPTTSAATWNDNRGCFVVTSSSGQLRLPDLNTTYGGLFARGGSQPGTVKRDQIQNINGVIDLRRSANGDPFSGNRSGAFNFTGNLGAEVAAAQVSNDVHQRERIEFDASRVARTGEETHPSYICGIWCIRVQ